jgi:catechol 2,3-dioxygenase-like lactoylglutathione lyase family enzyme
MITGLAHTAFLVSDLARSRRFYESALGFTHAFDFKLDTGEVIAHYLHISGRCFIELFKGQVEPPAKRQSYHHFCLEVDDIQATVRTLRERGVEVGTVALDKDNTWQVVPGEVTLGVDHTWQAWLTDPDGNRIELHQYTPQSWHAPWLK